MLSFFLPAINADNLKESLSPGREEELLELLATPLHEELYKRQTFDMMDELTEGQQLLLCYDYVSNQVKGGGVIQLLHNGYAGLLMDLPKFLIAIGGTEMALLMDDILKFYVQHRDRLDAELTVEEFARLYPQLPEAASLDDRFRTLHPITVNLIAGYAKGNLQEFIQ